MICTNCGNLIPDGANFCNRCGSPASAPAPAPVIEEAPQPAFDFAAQNAPQAAPQPAFEFAPQPAPQVASQPVYEPVTTETGVNFDFSTNTVSPASSKRYAYKVLSQKDKWFSGKFDPEILEQAMNAYAQQGWKVIGCATADIPGFGGPRQEFITILEREV